MKQRQLLLLALPIVAILLSGWAAPPKRTIFSDLEVGNQVGLKDVGNGYQISVLSKDIPQSHKIVGIGDDFIVLEDVAGVTRTTIPVFSIKSVVRLKTE